MSIKLLISLYRQLKSQSDELGEPQAWFRLNSKRIIEVVLEKEGLKSKEQFYSIRLHCNDDEYDEYHKAMGIIAYYVTGKRSWLETYGVIRHIVKISQDKICYE